MDINFNNNYLNEFNRHSPKRKLHEEPAVFTNKSGKTHLHQDTKRKISTFAHSELDFTSLIKEERLHERAILKRFEKVKDKNNDQVDNENEDMEDEDCFDQPKSVSKYDKNIPLSNCNFYIKNDKYTPLDFKKNVENCIDVIKSQEVGKRLIDKLDNIFCHIVIQHTVDENMIIFNGRKCMISFDGEVDRSIVGFDGELLTDPPFITLAHELIHAYHFLYEKNNDDRAPINELIWTNQEEFKTIIGSCKTARKKPKISENAIREEQDLPLRFGHNGFEELDNLYFRSEFYEETQKYLDSCKKN